MNWHPRRDAHPVAWEMRDGRRGHAYALIRQRPQRGRSVALKEYELVEGGVVIGVYATGDDASIVAWARRLQRAYPGREATVTDVLDAKIITLEGMLKVVRTENGRDVPAYPWAADELSRLRAEAARDRHP